MSSFSLLFEDELTKREAALSLFRMIRGWNCTSILTLEQEPSISKVAVSESIEFESDSILITYFIRERFKRRRYIEILKMRGTNHAKELYEFHIDKGGIAIDRKPAQIRLS